MGVCPGRYILMLSHLLKKEEDFMFVTLAMFESFLCYFRVGTIPEMYKTCKSELISITLKWKHGRACSK